MSERPNTLAAAAEATRKSQPGDDPMLDSRIASMTPTPGGPTVHSAGVTPATATKTARNPVTGPADVDDDDEPAAPLNMMLTLPPRMRMTLKVAFQASSRSEGRGKNAFVMFLLQNTLDAYIADKGLGPQLQNLLLKKGL